MGLQEKKEEEEEEGSKVSFVEEENGSKGIMIVAMEIIIWRFTPFVCVACLI